MKARAAVKDVARVLRIPPGEADRITKLIPSGPAYSLTIAEARAEGGRDAGPGEGQSGLPRLVDLSSRIEGISRHMSVHAAGVVIAPGPLAEYVPVCTAPTKGAGRRGRRRGRRSSRSTRWARSRRSACSRWTCSASRRSPSSTTRCRMPSPRGTGVRTSTWTRSTFDDPAVYELLRAGPHGGRLPVRVAARHRHAARHEVRPLRRPGRLQRPAPPRPARRRHAHGLHPAEAGPGEGHLPASRRCRRCSSRRTASSPIRSR